MRYNVNNYQEMMVCFNPRRQNSYTAWYSLAGFYFTLLNERPLTSSCSIGQAKSYFKHPKRFAKYLTIILVHSYLSKKPHDYGYPTLPKFLTGYQTTGFRNLLYQLTTTT